MCGRVYLHVRERERERDGAKGNAREGEKERDGRDNLPTYLLQVNWLLYLLLLKTLKTLLFHANTRLLISLILTLIPASFQNRGALDYVIRAQSCPCEYS